MSFVHILSVFLMLGTITSSYAEEVQKVPEAGSEDFSEWMQLQDDTCISYLTVTEFRCLLARRWRMELLSALEVQKIYAKFKQDIEEAHLIHYPVENWSHPQRIFNH